MSVLFATSSTSPSAFTRATSSCGSERAYRTSTPRRRSTNTWLRRTARPLLRRGARLIAAALEASSSKAAYLHGSFGSGKSHFMAVLHLLLRHDPGARSLPELRRGRCPPRLGSGRQEVPASHLPPDRRAKPRGRGARRLCGACRTTPPGRARPRRLRVAGGLRHRRADSGPPWRRAVLQRAQRPVRRRRSRLGRPRRRLDSPTRTRPQPPRRRPTRTISGSSPTSSPRSCPNTARCSTARAVMSISTPASRSSASTRSSLGYDAVVLFLDELVLWLMTRLADAAFVTQEATKVSKLVEAAARTVRRRSSASSPGSVTCATSSVRTFRARSSSACSTRSSGGRGGSRRSRSRIRTFPRSPSGASCARETTPRSGRSMTAFETSCNGCRSRSSTSCSAATATAARFRQTYPFTPAFVDTLVAASSALQRERTALKVMAEVLAGRRDDLRSMR